MKIGDPRRIHSFFYRTQFWLLLIFLWIITLSAGFVGFQQSGLEGDSADLWYSTVKLVSGGYPSGSLEETPLLNLSRFLSYFLMFATILVAIQTFFYEGTRRWWCVYRGGHTIICGMGSVGQRYIRSYLDAGDRLFIVIEANPQHHAIRPLQEEGALILTGDATDHRILERAGVRRAENLIAVTGSDTQNALIASICDTMREGNPEGFICNVHIVNPLLCNLLQARWYRKRLHQGGSTEDSGTSAVKLEAFNIFQLAGMLILEDYPPFPQGAGGNTQHHILIIGGGKLGEAIIQRLPHIWQTVPGISAEERFIVTLIDSYASERVSRFHALSPLIREYGDIIPVDITIGSSAFFSLPFLKGDDGRSPYSIIYICLNDYELGLYTALEIDEKFQAEEIISPPQIILRTRYSQGMDQLLGSCTRDHQDTGRIRIFPLIDRVCSPEFTDHGMLIEILARASHENYLKTCIENGESTRNLVPFRDLEPRYQQSNRDQAAEYTAVLQKFGYGIRYSSRWDTGGGVLFSSDEIEAMAEIEHNRWWAEKIRFGITESPDFAPYADLTPQSKDKDRNIFRNLHLILARVNMKVFRIDTPKDRDPGM